MTNRQMIMLKQTGYASFISLNRVLCLCIGLSLHPLLSQDLVRKAGYTLTGSYEHTVYNMLLLGILTNPTKGILTARYEKISVMPANKQLDAFEHSLKGDLDAPFYLRRYVNTLRQYFEGHFYQCQDP